MDKELIVHVMRHSPSAILGQEIHLQKGLSLHMSGEKPSNPTSTKQA
jgi:hypothetical protein